MIIYQIMFLSDELIFWILRSVNIELQDLLVSPIDILIFSMKRGYEYVSLRRIISRGKGTHTADKRFINDEDIENLPQKDLKASSNFVSKMSSYR